MKPDHSHTWDQKPSQNSAVYSCWWSLKIRVGEWEQATHRRVSLCLGLGLCPAAGPDPSCCRCSSATVPLSPSLRATTNCRKWSPVKMQHPNQHLAQDPWTLSVPVSNLKTGEQLLQSYCIPQSNTASQLPGLTTGATEALPKRAFGFSHSFFHVLNHSGVDCRYLTLGRAL